MIGRSSSSSGISSSRHDESPAWRSVMSSVSEDNLQDEGMSTLTLTNGIMGGEKTRALPKAFVSVTPLLREAFLTKEYCAISRQEEKLSGVFVIPSAQSSDIWFGVLFVRAGNSPYQGGIFRFTLRFPNDFPASTTIPIVTFQPPVYHPSIHPTRGMFDLRRSYKQGWNSNHKVWHILRIVRASFYKVEPTSSVNKSAHDLLENDMTQFNQRAQKEVESSIKRVFDDCPLEYNRDVHWIKFSQYDSKLHEVYCRAVQTQPKNSLEVVGRANGVQKGLSWM